MRRPSLLVALATLAAPEVACAHLVSTGIGPFYDGAAHFFASFEEVLPVLAIAMMAGLRGPRAARWTVAVLTGAWLAGSVIGAPAALAAPPPLAASLLLLLPGAIVAADRSVPFAVVVAVAAAVGISAGFLNGSAMAASTAGMLGVLGAASAAGIVATLSAALVVPLREGRTRIAVRVAGSWLAAVGLLALGWALKR